MHQTTCQIARETGIHHSPVYSIIHQDFQLKCLKKRHVQELFMATMYISQTCHSCYIQGRVGAHKLGVVGNTIHVLLQISSGTDKNYKNWFTNKKVIAKITRRMATANKTCVSGKN